MSLAQDVARVVVPAREARAVRLSAGDRVAVVDVFGGQVGDVFAFNADDPSEFLSASHTRGATSSLFPAVGQAFVTNRRRPILELVSDTSPGAHDMLIAACDPERYADLGHAGHASCADNLRAALGALDLMVGVVPQPVNVFMRIPVHPDSSLTWERALTAPGDSISFTAAMDCVFVVSACPQDLNDINGGSPTDLAIEIG
jgi:uncharacterized protein YcgI (DUF1989 family)